MALAMVSKLANSQGSLAVIREARQQGTRDVLDDPAYVAKHRQRLKRLYQGDAETPVSLPVPIAKVIEAIMSRDLLSSPEELIEKALGAYLDQHPKGREGVTIDWPTTAAAARAEIEAGAADRFDAGFAGRLAEAEREERSRVAEKDRANERNDREI